MMFWIVSSALAVLAAVPLLRALAASRSAARARADYDIAVYRQQLDDMESDLERGVITPEAAERTRTEIARRILDADRRRSAQASGRAPTWATAAAAAATALTVVGGSAAVYLWQGAPGYGDLPREARLAAAEARKATRPDQAQAETDAAPYMQARPANPEHEALVQRLREAVAERGGDVQGLSLLAQNEAALGNYRAAHEAQARLIELRGANASAEDFATYAEMLIMAAGGYVSPEAEGALGKALARAPANGTARYYLGLMHAQNDRPDRTFAIWQPLLENSEAGAPWVPAIRGQIADIAARAGERYDVPDLGPSGEAASGPDADALAAAEAMDPEARAEMVRGMVEGLADRLATQGGSSAEWARLIAALGVLGETDRARAIWQESRVAFEGDDQALAELRAAADRAGLVN